MSSSSKISLIGRCFRLTLRVWTLLGFLALIYGVILTNFTPVYNADGSLRIAGTQNLSGADAERLEAAVRLWREESGAMADPFTAGQAAFDIARLTHDVRWATQASEDFARAATLLPGQPQITAWEGSAQALVARDYPLQGVWHILAGPGLARIYYVKRSEALLNTSINSASGDPVVRLLRATVISQMPGLLVDHATAMQDFRQLADWDADASLNPAYQDVLTSTEWRRSFYGAYAEALALTDPNGAAQWRERLASLPKM